MARKFLITIPQILLIAAVVMLVSAVTVLAATGTTDSSSAPGVTDSYTLEDIYQRLDAGTASSQSSFTEPSVAPGTGTMHDLNDIMGAAPVLDNTDGATAANVLSGKTFWGLTNGEWGPQTGSITTSGSVNGAEGRKTFNIPDGYYSGETATCNDTQLTAEIIKENIDILGITGSFTGGCTCLGTMNGTRWCDNGNGTVTDMLGYDTYGDQCLVWLKDAGCIGEVNWLNAQSQVEVLKDGSTNFNGSDCGLSDHSQTGDWRLPTVWELQALMYVTEAVSAVNMRVFTIIPNSFFWTSNATEDHSSNVFGYAFKASGNYLGGGSNIDDATSSYAWPVRI